MRSVEDEGPATGAIPSLTTPSRRSRWAASALVLLAGAALVFEQSPANEALRVNAALEALDRTGSAVLVGLTVAALTVVIELTAAALITFGLHANSGAVLRLKQRLTRRDEAYPDDAGSEAAAPKGVRRLGRIGADIAISLGIGAGLVTLRRHVRDEHPTVRKDLAVSAYATTIVATVCGLIGYLAGGGLAHAHRVGLDVPARYVVDYGTDTRFWVAVLVAGYAVALVVRLMRRRREPGGSEPTVAPASGAAP